MSGSGGVYEGPGGGKLYGDGREVDSRRSNQMPIEPNSTAPIDHSFISDDRRPLCCLDCGECKEAHRKQEIVARRDAVPDAPGEMTAGRSRSIADAICREWGFDGLARELRAHADELEKREKAVVVASKAPMTWEELCDLEEKHPPWSRRPNAVQRAGIETRKRG